METSESRQELSEVTSARQEINNDYRMSSEDDEKGFTLKKRQILITMLFMYFLTIFIVRMNLSVAIVSMTDKNSSNIDFKEFKWNEKEKSAVLSSFFWGYLVMQAPAGQLGQYFSPKLLLLCTNLLSAILAALTPTAAYYGGWQLLCALRASQGLCQGFSVPLTYKLVSMWSPPHERNRFLGYSLNGATIGAAVALPLCGFLAQSSGGWPSIFYVSAGVSIIWSLFWLWLAADNPSKHSSISIKEKDEIEKSLQHNEKTTVYKTPWKAIFTSVPFFALVFTHLCAGWGLSMVMTETPSFINSVLKFNVGTNGVLSSIPFFSLWIFSFPACWLADYLQKNNYKINVRKVWTTFYFSGGSIGLIVISYIGTNTIAIMTTLTICITCTSFIFGGFLMNHLDLSPNFAGVLIGIANGLENITMILAPLSVGFIMDDPTRLDQWRIVFLITAAIGFLGNLIFIIFGSTKLQPWNTPELKDNEKNISLK